MKTTGKGEDACVHTEGSHDLRGRSAKESRTEEKGCTHCGRNSECLVKKYFNEGLCSSVSTFQRPRREDQGRGMGAGTYGNMCLSGEKRRRREEGEGSLKYKLEGL